MRFTLIFKNKQGIETAIPWFAFDQIHTDGRVTLSPTRLDSKPVQIESGRIIGWEMRGKPITADGFPGCPVHSRTMPGCDYCDACTQAVTNGN